MGGEKMVLVLEFGREQGLKHLSRRGGGWWWENM